MSQLPPSPFGPPPERPAIGPMGGMVDVRITVDRLRQQIRGMLGGWENSMREEIEQAVNAAVEHFDFAAELGQQVVSELRSLAQRLAHEIVWSRRKAVLESAEFRQMVNDEIDRQVREPRR